MHTSMYADETQLYYILSYSFFGIMSLIHIFKINSDFENLSQASIKHSLENNNYRKVEDDVRLTIPSNDISLVDRMGNSGLLMDNTFRYQYHITSCTRTKSSCSVFFPRLERICQGRVLRVQNTCLRFAYRM